MARWGTAAPEVTAAQKLLEAERDGIASSELPLLVGGALGPLEAERFYDGPCHIHC